MPALDFTELPIATKGRLRDRFELFARELLEAEGFRIIEQPDRGADGGRDLIVEEERFGPGGTNRVRWLVSCKHKAHSGASVTPADEQNIRDRLGTHRCTGFIAFYSTLPSSGLAETLSKLRPDYEYLQLDCEVIERKLLDSPRGRVLAARYLPKSFNAWMQASHAAATATPSPDPHRSFNQYFLRPPHDTLATALAEAAERRLPVFAVIFDPDHFSRSKIDYALGYFMEYQTTKRLVDQHFVALVGPSSATDLAAFVPEDDPLEACLWVVIAPDRHILRRERLYANPDEGLRRVREVIAHSDGANGAVAPELQEQTQAQLDQRELAKERASIRAKAQLMRDRLATRNHTYGDARSDSPGTTSYLAAMWDAEQSGHFYDEYHRSTFMPLHKGAPKISGDTIAEVQRNRIEYEESRRRANLERKRKQGD